MTYSIGLSGLRATNQELGVISQNIANTSTAGFKAGRAEFASLYGEHQPGGVTVAKVSQDFERNGDLIHTGRALDLAISGSGFFVTSLNGQTAYTRAGTFSQDANNYLVSGNGMHLQGYPANTAGQLQNGVIQDLKVSSANLPARASTRLELSANLKADASTIDVTAAGYAFDPLDATSYNYSRSSQLHDSLGAEHVLTQYFVKSGDNQWQLHYYLDDVAVKNTNGSPQVQALQFSTDGSLQTAGQFQMELIPAGADPMNLKMDIGQLSQYAADFSVTSSQSDGFAAGALNGVRVEADGSVFAVYTNGQRQLQGQVVMANFTNPDGLRAGDNNCWFQSFTSGQPTHGLPATGNLGSLTAGAYEGSNVDLTGELVNLMTAQRNYQANAKSISAADKMSQVLFNAI